MSSWVWQPLLPGAAQLQAAGGNKTIAADGTSYSFTAAAASLERGYEVVAGSVSYSFTAADAALERGYEVAADGTSYALTVGDVSLEFGREVVADGVAYNFTAADVTLTNSGVSKTLIADGTSYAFTVADASLEHGYEVSAESVAFSFTANATTLERGFEVLAEGVVYNFTAADASIERGFEIAADAAAYNFTPADVTLTQSGGSKILVAEGVPYSFTPAEASLIYVPLVTARGHGYSRWTTTKVKWETARAHARVIPWNVEIEVIAEPAAPPAPAPVKPVVVVPPELRTRWPVAVAAANAYPLAITIDKTREIAARNKKIIAILAAERQATRDMVWKALLRM